MIQHSAKSASLQLFGHVLKLDMALNWTAEGLEMDHPDGRR